jgi:hypothetical protein
MNEEFYCILKLVSGEELLSLVMNDDNDGDPILILQNPVTIKTTHTQTGVVLKVKPWMELSDDNFYIIRLDKVITMTETKDSRLIEIYNQYILENDSMESYSSTGEVKPSSRMGYISTVDDARKSLEEVFKKS